MHSWYTESFSCGSVCRMLTGSCDSQRLITVISHALNASFEKTTNGTEAGLKPVKVWMNEGNGLMMQYSTKYREATRILI